MQNPKLQYLTDYSPSDAPWDAHRRVSDDVGGIYLLAAEYERYGARMASCGGLLRFGWSTLKETGETRLRLREAHFCRVRHCPVCQWRRSLMWQARFYQSLPRIVADYPDARWMFLTLTVRNCAIGELGEMLNRMNAAFQRMKVRKEFLPVQGWIRTTEVTRGSDGSAHPHFHTLMMAPPGMLNGKSYVRHERWVELWRECLRVNYDPNVDVRAVKPRKPKDGESLACATAELVRGAVAETLKYSTKPVDMVADPEWFLELTRQTHKRRFVATGGALKDVLKLDQETDADMVIGDDISEGDDDGSRIAFEWKTEVRKYRRLPTKDKTESD
ncbi:protein rep [Salmonella enterica subsp. enterica serovar Typhimurium]|nr:protein rep [Salmonella enterica subsp. enterica serovar Typhimurium]EGH4476680.1 protein rep [Salmonella enterica subsp. enterica serovar Typhimurium]EGH6440132.1 protein rep [Salmonella enterica subsp. enterica serovar Typhimurium]EGI2726493.1 protein rep [Salmonella enterica subsp. enterica serovar Typhimurium]EIU8553938.1 protein rep [Salmonella enterica subsp. enterica serovar Typhimurium]